MEARLEVAHGRSNVKKVALRKDTVIGRSPDCNLRIASDKVSRRHCKISVSELGVWIRDFGSSNGTFINGERIQPETDVAVPPDANLSLGGVKFVVRYDPPKPPIDDAASTIDLPGDDIVAEKRTVNDTFVADLELPPASAVQDSGFELSSSSDALKHEDIPGIGEAAVAVVADPEPETPPEQVAAEDDLEEEEFALDFADELDEGADAFNFEPDDDVAPQESGEEPVADEPDEVVLEEADDAPSASQPPPAESAAATKKRGLFGMFRRKQQADDAEPEPAVAPPVAAAAPAVTAAEAGEDIELDTADEQPADEDPADEKPADEAPQIETDDEDAAAGFLNEIEGDDSAEDEAEGELGDFLQQFDQKS